MPALQFLIADPSPAIQTFICQELESYGFDAANIKIAASPSGGVAVATEIKIDFLLSDTFSREAMSGLGLHDAVRRFNPQCHLALMGAHPSTADQDDARQAGAYFLLAKPFTADQFRDALAQALQQLAQQHPQIANQVAQRTPSQSSAKAMVTPSKLVLPGLPHYKPGDQVNYLNRRETVKHVIVRRGELVVQLLGVPGMVEAEKLHHL